MLYIGPKRMVETELKFVSDPYFATNAAVIILSIEKKDKLIDSLNIHIFFIVFRYSLYRKDKRVLTLSKRLFPT